MERDEPPHEREPEPEPALAPVERRRRLGERLEDPVEQLGRDADPGVATRSTAASPSALERPPTRCRPRGVYFTAFERRFPTTCSSRDRVAVHRDRRAPGARRRAGPRPRSARRRHRLDDRCTAPRRSVIRRCSAIFPDSTRDTSSRSSTRRESFRVWRAMIAAGRSGSAGARSSSSRRGVDRGERVPQLVAEHREEVVAGPDGVRELREQVAHPVLALPHAERGGDRAEERGEPHRPIEQRHVAVRGEGVERGAPRLRRPRPAAVNTIDRQVRPGLLPDEPLRGAAPPAPCAKTSSATSAAAAPSSRSRQSSARSRATTRADPRPREDVAGDRSVPRRRREHDDPLRAARACGRKLTRPRQRLVRRAAPPTHSGTPVRTPRNS